MDTTFDAILKSNIAHFLGSTLIGNNHNSSNCDCLNNRLTGISRHVDIDMPIINIDMILMFFSGAVISFIDNFVNCNRRGNNTGDYANELNNIFHHYSP